MKREQPEDQAQPWFLKGRSCLNSLNSSSAQVTALVHEGKAVSVVCLEFNNALDTDSHRVFPGWQALDTDSQGVLVAEVVLTP